MHQYTAVIERCAATNLYVGHVPGLPGAHSQGATLDELRVNLVEVVQMIIKTSITTNSVGPRCGLERRFTLRG